MKPQKKAGRVRKAQIFILYRACTNVAGISANFSARLFGGLSRSAELMPPLDLVPVGTGKNEKKG